MRTAVAVLGGAAGAYVFASLNTSSCPSGSARIATVVSCRNAAAAMGLTYSGEGSYSNYPKGCYRWTTDGAVYFNPHATGGNHASSELLCSSSGTGTRTPTSVGGATSAASSSPGRYCSHNRQ